jgi:hypothetical protein
MYTTLEMVQLATHLLHMQTQLMSACSWLPFFLPSYALRYPALVATCAFISFIVHILHQSLDFGTSRLEHYTHGTGVWTFNIIFCCAEHQYQGIFLLHVQVPYRIVPICQTNLHTCVRLVSTRRHPPSLHALARFCDI